MAGQTYQVNYVVNVNATEAQSAINAFKRAVSSMNKATKPLTDLQRQVRGLMETMNMLNRGQYSVRINTKQATQKIGKLIRALQMAKAEIQQLNAMGVTLGTVGNKAKTSTSNATLVSQTSRSRPSRSTRNTTAASVKSAAPRRYTVSAFPKHPSNLGYKMLGATPLPSNGGMAIDMMKGMGIAYGIAGAGMLVSQIFSQATDYDNAMKTVENILKAHDTGENFAGRFAQMSQSVRKVGMQTKFKVTEVADAAKFLAMAGLDAEAIQQAMYPIADIALVGDTELGKTADVVTNIMTAYEIAPQRMRQAADVMTNTFTMSNTTLLEMAEAYKYAASLLAAGEVPFEEATAALGVLGDAGVKGSQAGTTMRTIMANIAKPTSKQQAGWDAIGISLTDKQGKRKDMLQIFQELNAKNLDVDAFYRIFHKTAATGAVALAAHVDKWEKVYMENFLSTGLTRQLAEEKQNTFQGLWAQLTSMFTDQGVTAFDSIQGVLRDWMKRAIAWLDPNQNPDAQKVFKRIADSLIEFSKLVKDASKWFVWFFDQFGGVIKIWVKFQLMIWPLVKGVMALKSALLGLMGLRKVGSMLFGFSAAFGSINRSFLAVGATLKQGGFLKRSLGHLVTWIGNTTSVAPPGGVSGSTMIAPFGGGMMGGGALTAQQYARAARGLDLRRPHALTNDAYWRGAQGTGAMALNSGVYAALQTADKEALQRYKANRKTFARRMRMMQMKNGMMSLGKMGVGAGALWFGMNQLTKDDANRADLWSGGLLSVAGMAAMAGGPVGWTAAIAASTGAFIASWISAATRFKQFAAALVQFRQSHQMLDGAMINSSSRTERYLEFVWRKNYDINDLIRRRTELMKEQLGLEDVKAPTTSDVGTDIYSQFIGAYEKQQSFFNGAPTKELVAALNEDAAPYGLSITKTPLGRHVLQGNGIMLPFRGLNEGESVEPVRLLATVASAAQLLKGTYRKQLVESTQHTLAEKLYSKSTADEVLQWSKQFAEKYGPSSYQNKLLPADMPTELSELKNWSTQQILDTYVGSMLLWESLHPVRSAAQAIANYKAKAESGTLKLMDVVNALKYGDKQSVGIALAEYNPSDVMGWYSHFGYDPLTGQFRDPNNEQTPETMARTAAEYMQDLFQALKRLGLDNSLVTEVLRRDAQGLWTAAQAYLGNGQPLAGAHDGEIKEHQGQKFRWDAKNNQWVLVGADGQTLQFSQALADTTKNVIAFDQALAQTQSAWPQVYSVGTQNEGQVAYHSDMVVQPFSSGQGLSWIAPWQKQSSVIAWQRKTGTTPFTLSPQQMGNLMTTNANKQTNPFTGLNTNNGDGGGNGTNTNDYKTTRAERATPKQININIKNLMNVDSIDLTNENNVAIIDKLKHEVAYALYEAAADGTMMLNGLV